MDIDRQVDRPDASLVHALRRNYWQSLGVWGIAGLLSGCASVPQYDSTTDTNLSALQSEIDSQLVAWISDVQATDAATKAKSTYANNISFYNKVDSDMLSLELRMEAVPDASTRNLPQYFSHLREIINNIKSTQQNDDAAKPPAFFVDAVLQQTRWQLAAQFAPLITYELTLKGVSSPSKATTNSSATSTATAKAPAAANH